MKTAKNQYSLDFDRIWNEIVSMMKEGRKLKELSVTPVNILKICSELLIISIN